MDRLKRCVSAIKKYVLSETGLYILFGALTTLVNTLVFQAGVLIGVEYLYANLIAWVLAVLFAFVTNKLLVFKSRSVAAGVLLKELLGFLAARLFSLGVDELGLWLLVENGIVGTLAAKIIMNVIVIVINYALSKFLIFKKK